MKVCTNCGAEYQENLHSCPYCGMQNDQVVKAQHADKIKELKNESARIKKLPQIIPRSAIKYLVIGALGLLIIFLIVLIFVFVGSKLKTNIEDNVEQKNIEAMEELLVAGDYQGFYEYYSEVDYAYAVYDKYEELDNLYYLYTRMWGDFDTIKEFGGKVSDEMLIEDFASAMNNLRKICNEADMLLNDSSRFGNEEYIETINEMGIDDFKTFMQVDDDVIDKIISVPMEEEQPELYEELAIKLFANLKAVNFGRDE